MERKDNWSINDVKAFSDAAVLLNRTPGGFGFRWNNEVRKEHEDSIKECKHKPIVPIDFVQHQSQLFPLN